jgi:hypothetical protein
MAPTPYPSASLASSTPDWGSLASRVVEGVEAGAHEFVESAPPSPRGENSFPSAAVERESPHEANSNIATALR